MKNFTRFENLLPDLTSTIGRFPSASLAAFGLCLYLNGWFVSYATEDQWHIVYAFCAAFIAAGAGELWGERAFGDRPRRLLTGLVLGAAAGAIAYFSHALSTSVLFLFPGEVLLLMIAGHLRKNVIQGAIWLFNLRLGLAIILAMIVGLVFGLGLSAVVAGLEFLFGIKLGSTAYEHVWQTAISLVGPLYGLSLVPRNLDEQIDMAAHKNSLLERGVSVLVNYVLVPLALAYALLLHVYAAKIALQANLPHGEIGRIVSLFAIGGTITWVIGWPWRESGSRLLQLFMSFWFWLLPIPILLLVSAITRRIGDYGVTPDRYGIALVSIWAVVVFCYLAVRRSLADMRALLGSAALLLLIGSFGPQGAFNLTGASQIQKLKSLLEKKGVLVGSKLNATGVTYPWPERNQGTTIISALRSSGQLERISDLMDLGPEIKLDANQKPLSDWQQSYKIEEALGLNRDPTNPAAVNFEARLPLDISLLPATRLVGPLEAGMVVNFLIDGKPLTADGVITSSLTKEGLVLQGSGISQTVNVKTILEQIKSAAPKSLAPRAPVVIELSPQTSLIVERAYGQLGESPKLNGIRFWLEIKP